jgi:hypothetical protein
MALKSSPEEDESAAHRPNPKSGKAARSDMLAIGRSLARCRLFIRRNPFTTIIISRKPLVPFNLTANLLLPASRFFDRPCYSQNAMSTNVPPNPLKTALAQRSVLDMKELLRREFKPTTEHETFLVELMAHARWKFGMFEASEAALVEKMMQGSTPVTGQDANALDRMLENPVAALAMFQRAQAAAERSYYKAHRELMQARALEARASKLQDQTLEKLTKPDLQNKPNLAAPAVDTAAAMPRSGRTPDPSNLALRL